MATSPLTRLRKTCLALPGAYETISHGEPTFWAGKRTFAMFANAANHHGNGRYAVWCKSTHMTQSLLVDRYPARYFVPPYAGPAGWVGIYLDKRPDWKEITERLRDAYRMVAPKKLLAQLDEDA